MAHVIDRRMTAEIEGPFVVFLIGMRINKFWKAWKWLPVFAAMDPMLRELEQRPEAGFLGASRYFGSPRRPMLIQYWRSFEHLERYARDPDAEHLPAWREFNRRLRASGDVGIWHETYRVRAGEYEAIYGDMPRVGLAAAGRLVPVGSTNDTAARRIGARDEDRAPVAYY